MEKNRYEFLKKRLETVVGKIYTEFLEKHPKEDICGFSIYSDESAMSASVAINTRKHLEHCINQTSGCDSYFRFWPNEWEYQSLESKGLDDVNDILHEAHFTIPEKQFDEHRKKIFDIMVDVMEELKDKNLFDGLEDDFVLIFTVTGFLGLDMAVGFARRLNSETIAQEYEAWIKDEELDDCDDDDVDWDDLDEEFED